MVVVFHSGFYGGNKIILCNAICQLLLLLITTDKILMKSANINPPSLIKSFLLRLKLIFGSINARKRFLYLFNLLFSYLVSLWFPLNLMCGWPCIVIQYGQEKPTRCHFCMSCATNPSMDALTANRSWQPSCSHGTYQHKAITSRSRQLLMVGTWLPETWWATIRREIKNTKSDI